MKIIQNAVRILDGGKFVYLRSEHRHHYNTYELENGESFAVDGGCEYFRRSFSENAKKYVDDYSLTTESTFGEVCEKLLWGSRGKSGNEPLLVCPFKELTKEHLIAIRNYDDKLKQRLSLLQLQVINYWIENQ